MAWTVSVKLFCLHYIPFDVTPIDCRRTYGTRTQLTAVNSCFRCITLRSKFSNETIPTLPITAWLSTIKKTHIPSSICRRTCTDTPTRFRCYYSTIHLDQKSLVLHCIQIHTCSCHTCLHVLSAEFYVKRCFARPRMLLPHARTATVRVPDRS